MKEREGLLFLCEGNRSLLRIVLLKQLGRLKFISHVLQQLGHPFKGHQCFLDGLLKALQVDAQSLSKLWAPRVAVRVFLGELTEHLTVGAEDVVLLAKEERIHCSSIHARTEEPLLTMYLEVFCKRPERLLRHAGVVDGELAGNVVKLLQVMELLEVRCGCRVRTCKDARVSVVRLIQRLSHVTHHEQPRRKLVAARLLRIPQVADIGTLPTGRQIGLRDVKAHHQLGLGSLPLQHVASASHRQL